MKKLLLYVMMFGSMQAYAQSNVSKIPLSPNETETTLDNLSRFKSQNPLAPGALDAQVSNGTLHVSGQITTPRDLIRCGTTYLPLPSDNKLPKGCQLIKVEK